MVFGHGSIILILVLMSAIFLTSFQLLNRYFLCLLRLMLMIILQCVSKFKCWMGHIYILKKFWYFTSLPNNALIVYPNEWNFLPECRLLHTLLLLFNGLATRILSTVSGGSKSPFSNRQNAIALLLVASQVINAWFDIIQITNT